MTHSVKFFVAHKKLNYAAWESQLTCELDVLLSYPKDDSSRLIVVEDRNPDITLVRIVQYDLTQVNVDRFRADINSDSKPDII